MKKKELQDRIKRYNKELFKIYPRYDKYLSLNNTISRYTMEFYYNNIVPEYYDYENELDLQTTIELAANILESISPNLKKQLLEKIKDNSIEFINETEEFPEDKVFVKENIPVSCTLRKDGKTKSYVVIENNLSDVLELVHEFMHFIHLEKVDDFYDESFSYFTEIFGLFGDFYSIFYLLKNNSEMTNDIKVNLCRIFNSLIAISDQALIFGTILDINKSKKSLSKENIRAYLKENNINYDFRRLIDYFEDEEIFNYHLKVPYIFSYPIAFRMALEIFTNPEKKQEYIKVFNNFCENPEDNLHALDLDKHLSSKVKLNELMSEIYTNVVDIFNYEKNKSYK